MPETFKKICKRLARHNEVIIEEVDNDPMMLSVKINGEIMLWLPLWSDTFADEWEAIDMKSGKPVKWQNRDEYWITSPGQIMYNFTSRSASRVYRTLVGDKFKEWIKK